MMVKRVFILMGLGLFGLGKYAKAGELSRKVLGEKTIF